MLYLFQKYSGEMKKCILQHALPISKVFGGNEKVYTTTCFTYFKSIWGK